MVLLNHWCIYVYNEKKIRSSRVYVHTWYILPLLKKDVGQLINLCDSTELDQLILLSLS